MKKTLFLSLLALLLFLWTGCQKDNIVLIDPVEADDAEDDIENTVFTQTVFVTFSEGDASVTGADDNFTVTINGNDVTLVYSGDEYVMYELSGGTTDGFFKLYSPRKQAITLNSVYLVNPNGAALNVQGTLSEPNKGKRTFIVLNGTNDLADGTSYTDTPSSEDEKGAMFGEGQFIFSGSGRLYVTATGKNGIVSDDYLSFKSGEVQVTSSAGHGIRGKDCIRVSGGDIQVNVTADMKKGFSTDGYVVIDGGLTSINVTGGTAYDSEDGEYTGSAGIKADGYFRMNGGGLTIVNTGTGGKGISCDGNGYFNGGQVEVYAKGSNYGNSGGGGFPPGGGGNSSSDGVAAKGIKCDGNLIFAGGTVYANSINHEAIEAKGSITITDGVVYGNSQSDDAINSGGDLTISGGRVFGASSGNDGIDSNGDCYIKGGLVFAIGSSSPEVAIDANTEGGYKLYLTGGTLIAIGGLEQGSSLTQSCYQASSWTAETWYVMTVGTKTYAFFTPTSTNSRALVVSGESTPTLKSGVSVTGGTSWFANLFFENADISGGTAVSLLSYTGGGGGGPSGGGGPGGGGGPF